MSTRVIRTIKDFARHRMDVDVVCYCGHRSTLPHQAVLRQFVERGWPMALGTALRHFRCSSCGSRPSHIGPLPR